MAEVAVLKAKRAQVLVRYRHPWVYSKGLLRKPNAKRGQLVAVCGEGGNHLGWAFYHPKNNIALRMVSFEECKPDAGFWRTRLAEASKVRSHLITEETNGYRLIHGENDGFPGLTVDVFGPLAVVQITSAGFDLLKDSLAQWLVEDLAVLAVYEKSDTRARRQEGLPAQKGFLSGQMEMPLTFLERGLRFSIDPSKDHKTGFYLDQRPQRDWVERHSHGARVLDLCCFTGGFSLAALRGRAENVMSVDTSRSALDQLEQHLNQNNLDASRQTSVRADMFEFFESDHGNQSFDRIILDPPSMAKDRGARDRALRGYRQLNRLAAKRVCAGGMLLTFSCTGVVSQDDFLQSVFLGLRDAGRHGRILSRFQAGLDHPVALDFPEGAYLKGYAIYLR